MIDWRMGAARRGVLPPRAGRALRARGGARGRTTEAACARATGDAQRRPADALFDGAQLVRRADEAWTTAPLPRPMLIAAPPRVHAASRCSMPSAARRRSTRHVARRRRRGRRRRHARRRCIASRRSRPSLRGLVLVPTEGLRRLCRLLADRLGIARLEIMLDPWLVARARDAFPGLPARTSESAHAQVIALSSGTSRSAACSTTSSAGSRRDDDKLPWARARLLHLFGDRDRLARVVAASSARYPSARSRTIAHTRAQFETTTERAHRHVDADRLRRARRPSPRCRHADGGRTYLRCRGCAGLVHSRGAARSRPRRSSRATTTS